MSTLFLVLSYLCFHIPLSIVRKNMDSNLLDKFDMMRKYSKDGLLPINADKEVNLFLRRMSMIISFSFAVIPICFIFNQSWIVWIIILIFNTLFSFLLFSLISVKIIPLRFAYHSIQVDKSIILFVLLGIAFLIIGILL